MLIPKKEILVKLYTEQKRSAFEVGSFLHTSEGKVNYWLKKYTIPKRSISEATYAKRNPKGDPFHFHPPKTLHEAFLYGMGLGLYWGEGNKRNKLSVRLGNSDPELLKTFITFLKSTYAINPTKLRFGLQIFSDISPRQAVKFWSEALAVPKESFHKVIITETRGKGSYRYKSQNGVLTVYFNNKKLRDIICQAIENIDGTLLKVHKPM